MQIDNQSKILIIAAHPDDEVLGMGGAMSKFRKLGAEVIVQFLGEGISARFNKSEFGNSDFEKASAVRMSGARKALKALDVYNIKFGEHYCCRFDRLEILDLVKDIEASILSFDPTHIFTHNPLEVNIDHRITYRAVETAVRPKLGSALKAVYGFEIICSGNWSFDGQLNPSTYVDISEEMNAKLKAWSCYTGEERPFPFPRSIEGIKTLAKLRGIQSGLSMAEGFKLFREIY